MLVPVFVVLLLPTAATTPWRLAGVGGLRVAMVTDLFDGRSPAARPGHRLRQDRRPDRRQGDHGSALIGLSVLGDLPWWVTVVILVRELGITLLRFG